MASKTLVPIRYAAWLIGETGGCIEAQLKVELAALPEVRVTRLPRGILVETGVAPGMAVEALANAMAGVEAQLKENYPVFSKEMGPAWTGTLQTIFPEAA